MAAPFVAVTVWACPSEEAHEVLAALDPIFEGIHTTTPRASDPARDGWEAVVLGEPYSTSTGAGTGEEIAGQLVEHAPHAAWEVQQDAFDEAPGAVFLFTPSLGLFTAEGSTDDGERFVAADFLAWIDEWEADEAAQGMHPAPAELRALVDSRTGRSHRASFEQARQSQAVGHAVVPLPECAHCDDRVQQHRLMGWVHASTGGRECPPPPEQTYATPEPSRTGA